MHLLIVEHEIKTANLLKNGLKKENHSVNLAFDGRDALELAQVLEYDAIVLNAMIAGIDGFEVTRRLRNCGNKTPILVLSASDSVSDVVKGLDLGADDYMTKPFSFEEFLARLRSVSRSASSPLPAPLRVGDLILNPATRKATRMGKELPLTPTEYRLLECLMRRGGKIVPKSTIISIVWNSTGDFEENTLHAFMKGLRNKIDRGHKVKLIENIRNFGYGVRESKFQ